MVDKTVARYLFWLVVLTGAWGLFNGLILSPLLGNPVWWPLVTVSGGAWIGWYIGTLYEEDQGR